MRSRLNGSRPSKEPSESKYSMPPSQHTELLCQAKNVWQKVWRETYFTVLYDHASNDIDVCRSEICF